MSYTGLERGDTIQIVLQDGSDMTADYVVTSIEEEGIYATNSSEVPSRTRLFKYVNGNLQGVGINVPHSAVLNPPLSGIEDTDLALLINMDYESLILTCQVSKRMQKICRSDMLWKLRIENEYGVEILKYIPQNTSLRQSYENVHYAIKTIQSGITRFIRSPLGRKLDVNASTLPFNTRLPFDITYTILNAINHAKTDVLYYLLSSDNFRKYVMYIMDDEYGPDIKNTTAKEIITTILFLEDIGMMDDIRYENFMFAVARSGILPIIVLLSEKKMLTNELANSMATYIASFFTNLYEVILLLDKLGYSINYSKLFHEHTIDDIVERNTVSEEFIIQVLTSKRLNFSRYDDILFNAIQNGYSIEVLQLLLNHLATLPDERAREILEEHPEDFDPEVVTWVERNFPI